MHLLFVENEYLCNVFTLILMRKQKRRVGIHIWRSVYYGALFFDFSNVSQTKKLSKSKATVDVRWVCNKTTRIVPMLIGQGNSIHTRVDFCVARP